MTLKELTNTIIEEAKKVPADGGSVEVFRDFVHQQLVNSIVEDRQKILAICHSCSQLNNDCLRKGAEIIYEKIQDLEIA